jgi:hypothetical protein
MMIFSLATAAMIFFMVMTAATRSRAEPETTHYLVA